MTPLPAALVARLAAAGPRSRARADATPRIRVEPRTGARLVCCADCGADLHGWVPLGDPIVIRDAPMPGGGREVVLQQPVALARLATYTRVQLTMADGSHHVTNACADCAPRLVAGGPEAWEAHFLTDVQQWVADAEADGSGTEYGPLWRATVPRVPVAADILPRD